MTTGNSIFNDEERIIARAHEMLDHESHTLKAVAYSELLDQYEKLYRQSIRLVKMGDRMQGQLNRLYDQLAKNEEQYRSIFERSIQGIFMSTADGRFLAINPAMARMFGYNSAGEMVQEVNEISVDIYFPADQRRKFFTTLQHRGEVKDYPLELRRRDGEMIRVEISAKGIFDDSNNLIELEGLVADVTEKHRMLEELTQMARVDALTGLWNRRYFVELGLREVARAKRGEYPLAMLFFDIDNFKTINDTYGHQAGDVVLNELATIGLSHLRELDIFGRLGGDEFAILLPDTTAEGASLVAERMRASFEKHTVLIAQKRLRFTASFGVVRFCDRTPCLTSLIKYADQALYMAKSRGRNTISCADPIRCNKHNNVGKLSVKRLAG